MELLEKEEYAIAHTFLPILNTPDFFNVFGGKQGNSMPLDEQGLIRAVESIALPNSKCKIVAKTYPIVQIQTTEYPYKGPFFTDERFLKKVTKQTKHRKKNLPSLQEILTTLSSLLGTRYLWGGNCPGLSEMIQLYPPKEVLSPEMICNWTLKGFDCSGLIYYACQGITPRNTSSWISYGKPLLVEGKSIQEIIKLLKPLDAIFWKGHILFVYDSFHTIESRVGKGVILTKIEERFLEILESGKTPKNAWQQGVDQFLIRRWHPDSLA